MLQLLVKLIKEKHFLSLAGNFFTAVFGFLTFIILVRSLDKESFGEWVLFITAATLSDLLRFGVTRVALTRYLSGIQGEERKEFIGSSWLIGLLTILIFCIILFPALLIFPKSIHDSGFYYFFILYPLLALSNLPFGNALSILQADEKFGKIFILRIVNVGGFLLYLIINYVFFKSSVFWIIIWFIITNVIPSLISTIFQWDGSRYILSASRKSTLLTYQFGKYSMGTSIGSSLLKSADTFIIGLSSFLGPTAVALYSIPVKFTEIIEIILRSFTAIAFPQLSKASIENKHDDFRKVFYSYSGALTIILIPICVISAVFAKDFILLLGGSQYKEYVNGLAVILLMFIIFSLLLPIDRFTGISLDSINKPNENFKKVFVMTSINIIGDLIAVFLLPVIFPSISMITVLVFVSVGSIFFQLSGLLTGYYLLNKDVKLQFLYIFKEGWLFLRIIIKKFSLKRDESVS